MIKQTTSVLLAGLACMVLSVTANASPVTLTNQGWTNGYVSGTITPGGGVAAGEFKFTVNGTGETLSAFCIDVATNLVTPGTYNVVAASSHLTATQLDLIGKLYDLRYASITGSATNSAAFQLAVWEIIYDEGTLNLTNGSFSASAFGTARATAQAWLTELLNSDFVSPGLYQFDVLKPVDGFSSQTLLTARLAEVPEPGTLALLGLGLLGAGAMRRRRTH